METRLPVCEEVNLLTAMSFPLCPSSSLSECTTSAGPTEQLAARQREIPASCSSSHFLTSLCFSCNFAGLTHMLLGVVPSMPWIDLLV